MTSNHDATDSAADFALRAMISDRQAALRTPPHSQGSGRFPWSSWLTSFRRRDPAR